MALLFNSLLLIAGLVTTGVGLATLRYDYFNWLIVAIGVGIIGVAWHLDRQRVRRRDETVAKEIADRTAVLTGRPWQSHDHLEIPSNRWLLGLALGMTLGGGSLVQFCFNSSGVEWPLVLAGVFLLAFGAFTLPSMLAGIGKPALVLDRKGLTTPVDGAILWSAVEGIYLQVVDNHGTKNYSLLFRVPAYAKVVQSIHWSQRWLALFGLGPLRRGVVGISLQTGKERPETIEAVARYLWKSATGHEYFWNPNASAASNESFRQIATLRSSMTDPATLAREFREKPDQAIARMEEEMKRLDQVRHHFDVIKDDQHTANRKLRWVIVLALAGMLVSLIWPWVKQSLAS